MSNKFTRRQMLKLTGGVAAGTVLARYGMLPAFAQDGLPFSVASGADNPFGIGAAEVDGLFFEGGFGSEYIKNAANWMETLHDGVTVKVSTAQQITEALMPRLISGDAPDVVDGSNTDTGALIAEGQLLDLTPLFEAPAL
ncbi:MAG TPA: extracellular solute-binding protein, partial [Aggregatilinea sp.]|uniref:extracellular solute-binding protein n=1 Tax=Aggregatilinea sp. TaxID=2806333 RepID=UPI002C5C6BD0